MTTWLDVDSTYALVASYDSAAGDNQQGVQVIDLTNPYGPVIPECGTGGDPGGKIDASQQPFLVDAWAVATIDANGVRQGLVTATINGDHAYDEVGSGYEEPRAEFEEREFLHGVLTRKEAEGLLATMPEGAFLVREKDPPSSWVRACQQITRFTVHIQPTAVGRVCACRPFKLREAGILSLLVSKHF